MIQNIRKVILILLISCFSIVVAHEHNPSDPSWSVYASGVGQKLKVGMDPCWITYTVGHKNNKTIKKNVKSGTMGVIASNVNWHEASRIKRLHGRYFEDQPDGKFKLKPCEVSFEKYGWTAQGSKNRFCSQELLCDGGIPKCNASNAGKVIQDRRKHNNCVAQGCDKGTQIIKDKKGKRNANFKTYVCKPVN